MSNPRPCSIAEATQRLRAMVGMDIEYRLATGNYHEVGYGKSYDCAGAALCEAFRVKRHRPGFARGPLPNGWEPFADVVDDINTNSAIKDALLRQDLFRFVPEGETLLPGDLLMYPTIRLTMSDMQPREWIGHVQMVILSNMVKSGGPYAGALIAHCHGPNGRRPAVTLGDAHVMDVHNQNWQKAWAKAWAMRVVA